MDFHETERARQSRLPGAHHGFTLLELMVVVAVLAVVASIAIPSLLGSRIAANERVVLASLRSLTTAQTQFRQQRSIDLDGDGVGEYGTIGELLGAEILRGDTERLDPPLVSRQISTRFDGVYHQASGYYYALYLPDLAGNGVNASLDPAAVDPGLASGVWTCIAWPSRAGIAGNTTFFVNQQGEVVKNANTTYEGTFAVPPPGAALDSADPLSITATGLATHGTAADGRRWTPVQG